MVHWGDHALVLLFAVFQPAWELSRAPRLKRAIEAGEIHLRVRDYRRTIGWEWGFVGLLAVVSWVAGRSATELGLVFPAGWRFWLGMGAAVLVSGYLLWQPGRVAADEAAMEKIRKQLRSVEWWLPHGGRELPTFLALSVTAGICEEILYRGYLLGYLGNFVDPWLAVLVSTILFGLAHLYLGPSHAVRAFVVGLVMAGLYILTASLLAPILLHAAIDVGSGRLVSKVFAVAPVRLSL